MNTQEKKLLEADRNVVLTDNGIDQWGLFFEALEVRSNTVTHQVRVFLAGKTVCHYILPVDQSRTVWRMTIKNTIEEAEALAASMITKNRVLRGAPMLVQFTSADAEHVAKGQMPGARYRGQYAVEKIYGKFKEAPLDISKINLSIQSPPLVKCMEIRAAAFGTATSTEPEPAKWAEDPSDPPPF